MEGPHFLLETPPVQKRVLQVCLQLAVRRNPPNFAECTKKKKISSKLGECRQIWRKTPPSFPPNFA